MRRAWMLAVAAAAAVAGDGERRDLRRGALQRPGRRRRQQRLDAGVHRLRQRRRSRRSTTSSTTAAAREARRSSRAPHVGGEGNAPASSRGAALAVRRARRHRDHARRPSGASAAKFRTGDDDPSTAGDDGDPWFIGAKEGNGNTSAAPSRGETCNNPRGPAGVCGVRRRRRLSARQRPDATTSRPTRLSWQIVLPLDCAAAAATSPDLGRRHGALRRARDADRQQRPVALAPAARCSPATAGTARARRSPTTPPTTAASAPRRLEPAPAWRRATRGRATTRSAVPVRQRPRRPHDAARAARRRAHAADRRRGRRRQPGGDRAAGAGRRHGAARAARVRRTGACCACASRTRCPAVAGGEILVRNSSAEPYRGAADHAATRGVLRARLDRGRVSRTDVRVRVRRQRRQPGRRRCRRASPSTGARDRARARARVRSSACGCRSGAARCCAGG